MIFEKYKEEFSIKATEAGYDSKKINDLLSYAENLNNQGLAIIYDQEHLSRLVGYNYDYILSITNNQSFYYKRFVIPKKNGGERIIHEPYPSLKEIQYWILKNILEPASYIYVSAVAKAFMPHRNLRSNARFHKNKNCVIALDLHDFFGSVKYGEVYAVFKRLGYNKSVSTLLSNLCILENSLPQGSPTSPMMSNLIFKRLDDKIFSYCRKRNIIYTRYADDLVFSSNNLNPKRIISYIKMIVSANGFIINDNKTKVMKKGMCQIVTGIVVNKKIQLSRAYRDKIRQEVYYSIKYGVKSHITKIKNLPKWIDSPNKYLAYLYGKINYVLQVNPKDEDFMKYKKWIKEKLNQRY